MKNLLKAMRSSSENSSAYSKSEDLPESDVKVHSMVLKYGTCSFQTVSRHLCWW